MIGLARLAARNIAGTRFRSWVVFLCALVIGGLTVSMTLVLRGTEVSLRLAQDRLGADLLVVPQGAESRIENALLMGVPTRAWMPRANVAAIARVPGVAAASPQLYLSTLANAACCSAPEMFLVAFEPATDFTITPWLNENLGSNLRLGEAVAGHFVFVPEGEPAIKVYGHAIHLRGNLQPTGTGLDQSLFFTFETAQAVARLSLTEAVVPLEIPADSVSAVLVKLAPGANAEAVAAEIMRGVSGVTPLLGLNLFSTFRQQMISLRRILGLAMGITWALSIVLIGLVFSMAVHERRREIGVLRALGSTRRFVFGALLAEAGLLAAGGGLAGVGLAVLVVYLFRNLLVRLLGLPFLLPDPVALLFFAAAGLVVPLLSGLASAVLPVLKISRQEPALAMRE